MEPQYIWPRRLLEYLCEIERRLKKMRTTPYATSDTFPLASIRFRRILGSSTSRNDVWARLR